MRAAMHRNTNLVLTSLFSLLAGSLALATLTSERALASTLDEPVVGGTTAKLGTWPDAVAVLTKDGGLCTGTLLAADLVLTAGHCTEPGVRAVIVGNVDLSKPGGDVRAAKWSMPYPNWQSSYDVGIVMLENPVAAKPRAIAAGCSTRKELARGSMLEVVGFGLTTAAGTGENTKLHQGKIAVTDGDCTGEPACEASVAPGGEFVAGGNGADACFGDSGGPVYITTTKGPALIGVVSRGIVSAGEPCGDGGVYVRADKVVDWIEKMSGRRVERTACELPADGAAEPDSDGETGGCNATGEAAGGAFILFVLTALWVLTWNRARRRS